MLNTSADENDESSGVSIGLADQVTAEAGWGDAWLQGLIVDLPGVVSAILVLRTPENSLQPSAVWPLHQQSLDELGDLVDECSRQSRALVVPAADEMGMVGIAYPVMVQDQLRAILACRFPMSTVSIDAHMAAVEKNCLWLEHHYLTGLYQQQQSQVASQRAVLDGYLAVGKNGLFKESALEWVDTLVRDYRCDRVSLGFVKKGIVALEVISGSSEYALNTSAAKQILMVMQEACDQKATLRWPKPEGDASICLQTEKFSINHLNSSVLVLPIYHGDELAFIFVLERPGKDAFQANDAAVIEAGLTLVSGAFHYRRLAESSVLSVARRRMRESMVRFISPGHVKRKVIVLCLFTLIILANLVTGEYQVNADAVLEPRQTRIISAPLNGYIKSALVKAGDRVTAGDVLASMEDRELRLEKIKAISQQTQSNKQYTDALAGRDRAQAQIFFAQMEQAKAQMSSAESQLQRSVLQAPFDALVVKGDLSQRIGGSVNQGEELFQLSPMKDYRLILYVSEFQILDLNTEQGGKVVLSSMPDVAFDFEVEKLTPITEVRNGETVFKVEAYLNDGHALFRPGLVGVAKVSVGRELLVDIWTRDMRKWLSLKLWSFWG